MSGGSGAVYRPMLCPQCRSEEQRWRVMASGDLMCAVCGAQAADVRNVQDETDYIALRSQNPGRFVAVSRQLNADANTAATTRAAVRAAGGRTSAMRAALDPALESELFLECFQYILRAQCQALVSLGCSPHVFGLVGRFWFAYLRSWQGPAWAAPSSSAAAPPAAPFTASAANSDPNSNCGDISATASSGDTRSGSGSGSGRGRGGSGGLRAQLHMAGRNRGASTIPFLDRKRKRKLRIDQSKLEASLPEEMAGARKRRRKSTKQRDPTPDLTPQADPRSAKGGNGQSSSAVPISPLLGFDGKPANITAPEPSVAGGDVPSLAGRVNLVLGAEAEDEVGAVKQEALLNELFPAPPSGSTAGGDNKSTDESVSNTLPSGSTRDPGATQSLGASHGPGAAAPKVKTERVVSQVALARPSTSRHWTPHSVRLERGDLSMPLTLAICYLACQFARDPVTVFDFHRWAESGALPFYNLSNGAFLEGDVRRFARELWALRLFLSPKRMIAPLALYTLSQFVGATIGVRIDTDHAPLRVTRTMLSGFGFHLNAPLLCGTLLRRIGFPSPLLPAALNLLVLTPVRRKHTECSLLALVVVAVKLCYALHLPDAPLIATAHQLQREAELCAASKRISRDMTTGCVDLLRALPTSVFAFVTTPSGRPIPTQAAREPALSNGAAAAPPPQWQSPPSASSAAGAAPGSASELNAAPKEGLSDVMTHTDSSEAVGTVAPVIPPMPVTLHQARALSADQQSYFLNVCKTKLSDERDGRFEGLIQYFERISARAGRLEATRNLSNGDDTVSLPERDVRDSISADGTGSSAGGSAAPPAAERAATSGESDVSTKATAAAAVDAVDAEAEAEHCACRRAVTCLYSPLQARRPFHPAYHAVLDHVVRAMTPHPTLPRAKAKRKQQANRHASASNHRSGDDDNDNSDDDDHDVAGGEAPSISTPGGAVTRNALHMEVERWLREWRGLHPLLGVGTGQGDGVTRSSTSVRLSESLHLPPVSN